MSSENSNDTCPWRVFLPCACFLMIIGGIFAAAEGASRDSKGQLIGGIVLLSIGTTFFAAISIVFCACCCKDAFFKKSNQQLELSEPLLQNMGANSTDKTLQTNTTPVVQT